MKRAPPGRSDLGKTMTRLVSARRHAQAIFEIALDKGELEKWRTDLNAIAAVMRDRQLVDLLQNPRLHFVEKAKLLNNLLPDLGPLARNFIHLLVLRNRLGLVDEIVAEYDFLIDAYYGVEHATVITAIPLDKEEQEQIKQKLSAITGKQIILNNKTDANLVGGMVVRVGDKLVDGSLRGRLKRLKQSLMRGAG